MSDDTVLDALEELVAVGRANIVAWVGVMSRVDEVRTLRTQGVAYSDMSLSDGIPIIGAIGENQERLTAAAARFRRAAVKQLHDEGMGAAAIARAFGVTRQRVAVLLADDAREGEAATSIDASRPPRARKPRDKSDKPSIRATNSS